MFRKAVLLHSFIISSLFVNSFISKDNKNADKLESKKKIEFKLHSKIPGTNIDAEFLREFTSDIVGNTKSYCVDLLKNLKKHPAFFACMGGSMFGYNLYRKDICELCNNVGQYIDANRGCALLTGISILFAAYLKKDYLLKQIPDDNNKNSLQPAQSSNGGDDAEMNIVEFSKSAVRVYRPGEIKVRFEDVAGLETAKEELSDILMFLRDPNSFFKIGAKIPSGILLSGKPGNGKTLLARALAGEVNCPFLYVSASEFIQAIVGIGAARVRSLFAIARDLAPCIVFIDEIDAIGRKRGVHGFGGDTELAQTLNQLLVEMDGFEQKSSIVVIGATNRVDILDPALMRPGRFDRKIEVVLPFVNDRIKILSLHIKDIVSDPSLDIYKIAMSTPGFSGADLAHLVNEAAILALREGKDVVCMNHFDRAIDNINLGRESKGMEISKLELWHTAIHEAGHALAIVYQDNCDPLHKVTIVPRNGILGVTFSMSVDERYCQYVENFKSKIVIALSGSVAEEIMYGGRGVSAHSDIKTARDLATQMVMQYGMTEEFKDITFEDYIENGAHLPDALSLKLQNEINKIIKECRQISFNIISAHKDKLQKLIDMLLEKGTVDGKDVYKLCDKLEPKSELSFSA